MRMKALIFISIVIGTLIIIGIEDFVTHRMEASGSSYALTRYYYKDYPELRPLIKEKLDDHKLTRKEWSQIKDIEKDLSLETEKKNSLECINKEIDSIVIFEPEASGSSYALAKYYHRDYPELRPLIKEKLADNKLTRKEWDQIRDVQADLLLEIERKSSIEYIINNQK